MTRAFTSSDPASCPRRCDSESQTATPMGRSATPPSWTMVGGSPRRGCSPNGSSGTWSSPPAPTAYPPRSGLRSWVRFAARRPDARPVGRNERRAAGLVSQGRRVGLNADEGRVRGEGRVDTAAGRRPRGPGVHRRFAPAGGAGLAPGPQPVGPRAGAQPVRRRDCRESRPRRPGPCAVAG